jgi:hypothetical protein
LLSVYRDLLGFRVSDYALKPCKLYFFLVSGRHHSLAIVGFEEQNLHYFVVEGDSPDDVGQGYDPAQL